MKSVVQQMDEQTKYGFELAVRYAELAQKYNKDIVQFLKDHLAEWEDK